MAPVLTAPNVVFRFRAEVWLWPGTSPWHFVSLPEEVADLIAASSEGRGRRFGSVPVEVTVDDLTWRTSVFPDRKSGTFLLPLKKQVRQHLDCGVGDTLEVGIRPE